MRRAAALLLVLMLLALSAAAEGAGLEIARSVPLRYAEHFTVDELAGGGKLLTVSDGSRYLVLPEGVEAPEALPADICIIRQPLDRIYLAATAVMCLFDALDAVDSIRFSGSREESWSIASAREAMHDGRIIFAGKYSEPDWELLLAGGCRLAVESLMIGHASDVADKLRELNIPVLTDHSSLEPHPLGRLEWIRFYGVLLGCEETADALFEEQVRLTEEAAASGTSGRTAAFFYISSTGRIVTRRSGDYVSRMIELASGEYIFGDMLDSGSAASTVTMEPEAFYAAARDADVIIYNSTIGGEISSIAELIDRCPLFEDFRAVKTGQVWCTDKNMYQQTTETGVMIRSFHEIFSGAADEVETLPYLVRLH